MAVGEQLTSLAWGGVPYPVTQEAMVPGFKPSWYQYSKDYGTPAGYHIGIDVRTPRGTPIYALNPGRVIREGFNDSFRPYPVYIETDDNPATTYDETGHVEIYGHLQTEVVQAGQRVQPGQLLGYSGEQTVRGTTTPDGSGPHIHFELRQPDPSTSSGYRAIEPSAWLSGAPGTPQTRGLIQSLPGVDDVTGALSDVGSEIARFAKRALLVLIGAGALAIGANALLREHAGVDVGRAAKLASSMVPAARVARMARV